MEVALAKIGRLILGLIDGKSDIFKKTIKGVVIVIISPFVAVVIIIAAIFSDGISFNHNLSLDLFNGNTISEQLLESSEQLRNLQDDLKLIDAQINEVNETLASGTLNVYQVKGYYIGFMFSNESRSFDQASIEVWVTSYTVHKSEEAQDKIYPTSINSIIYDNLQVNLGLTLNDDTKVFMENVYSSLIGNEGGTVTTLSQEEINQLVEKMPENITELRKKIVVQAADAVGKIPYYWGGTASKPGYEGNDFGTSVKADEGGRSKKGLDCSHFVDWVYWTVMNNNLGNTNTTGQIKMSKKISKDDLKPGDLAFLMNKTGQTTHVGIYAGKNEKGELVWIHENAYDNNVGINTVSYWSGYYRLNIMEGK